MSDFAAACSAIAAATAILLPVLIKAWRDIQQLKRDQKVTWDGYNKRGYIEAQATGNLTLEDGEWVVLPKARATFDNVSEILHSIHKKLKSDLGRTPTDAEIGWAIECYPYAQGQTMQDWMVKNACPNLGMHDHGCIAVASVLAREEGERDTKRPNQINENKKGCK